MSHGWRDQDAKPATRLVAQAWPIRRQNSIWPYDNIDVVVGDIYQAALYHCHHL